MSRLKKVGKVALIIVLMPLMPFVALASIPVCIVGMAVFWMYMTAKYVVDGCPKEPSPIKRVF